MTYQATVLADNPVSYWRLGEASGTSAVDEKGVQNGVYGSGVTLAQSGPLFGVSDTAALFDGTVNAVVSLASNAAHNLAGPISMEAWVKLSGVESWNVILGMYDMTGNPFNGYGFRIFQGNPSYYQGGGGSNWTGLSVGVNDGAWHYVAAVAVTTGVSMYIDGHVVGSALAITAPSTSWTGVRTLGCDTLAAGGFNGSICEVAVYSTALNPDRILAHYNIGIAGSEGTPPPPFEEYPPARGSG